MKNKHVKLKNDTALKLNKVKGLLLQDTDQIDKITDDEAINIALKYYIVGENK